MNYTNYKEVYLNKDGEEDSNGERIIRKNNKGIRWKESYTHNINKVTT